MVMVVIILSAVGLNFTQAAVNKVENSQGTVQKTVDANGVTKIVLFENNINQFAKEIIDSQLKGFIKTASIKILDGYAEITAVAQKPITATLFIRVQINVANNKLYPKILKMRYGFLPIPNFLIYFLIGKLIGQNSQNFQSIGVEIPGVEWRSVDLKNGEATIEFKEINK